MSAVENNDSPLTEDYLTDTLRHGKGMSLHELRENARKAFDDMMNKLEEIMQPKDKK